MKTVNLYKQGQEIIKLKQQLNSMDYETNLNAELLEEHIMELEGEYVHACNIHDNDPSESVLQW